MSFFSRNYKPDTRGIAEIARDPRLGAVCVSVASAGAALANQVDPDGAYRAAGRTVSAGWRNESRAGAVIAQTGSSWAAERNRVLVEVARQLNSR